MLTVLRRTHETSRDDGAVVRSARARLARGQITCRDFHSVLRGRTRKWRQETCVVVTMGAVALVLPPPPLPATMGGTAAAGGAGREDAREISPGHQIRREIRSCVTRLRVRVCNACLVCCRIWVVCRM